jgi:hypothetical protein
MWVSRFIGTGWSHSTSDGGGVGWVLTHLHFVYFISSSFYKEESNNEKEGV